MNLLSMVVTAIVTIGYVDMLLRYIRGEKKPPYGEFFRKIDVGLVFKYVVFNLVFGVAVILGFFLFIVPGIYVAVTYGFVGPLLIDKGFGLGEAMKKSEEMSSGIKMNLLAYGVLSIGVILLGLIAFFVGVFAAIPVAYLGWLNIYNKLLKS